MTVRYARQTHRREIDNRINGNDLPAESRLRENSTSTRGTPFSRGSQPVYAIRRYSKIIFLKYKSHMRVSYEKFLYVHIMIDISKISLW